MPDPIVIRLAGEPRGKGRARSTMIRPKGRAPFISTYSQPETAMYESHLRLAAQDAMEGRMPLSGQLQVVILARFSIPASWSARKQKEARLGLLRPTKKPDFDNIAKLCDPMNKVVWTDDAIIVDGAVRKLFGEAPELVFIVSHAVSLGAASVRPDLVRFDQAEMFAGAPG